MFSLRPSLGSVALSLLSGLQLQLGAHAIINSPSGWSFVQNGTSGVLALEAMVVSPTLAIFFDRATNDPLQIDNHTAWGALWDFQTNTALALDVVSDTFCASGGFLSNGTMVGTMLSILQKIE
jgi:hypothetical protein